jgi:hypothetical protein
LQRDILKNQFRAYDQREEDHCSTAGI